MKVAQTRTERCVHRWRHPIEEKYYENSEEGSKKKEEKVSIDYDGNETF